MDIGFKELFGILAVCAIIAIVYVYYVEPHFFGTTAMLPLDDLTCLIGSKFSHSV